MLLGRETAFCIPGRRERIEKKTAAELKEAKERIQKAVKSAKKIIDKGIAKYTDKTWNVFKKAYHAAKNAPRDAKTAKLIKLAADPEHAREALKKKLQA